MNTKVKNRILYFKATLVFLFVILWAFSPFAHISIHLPILNEDVEIIPEVEDVSAASDPWWDSNFQNRLKITFNNAPSSENLHNFPMPIKLTENANDEWSAANIDYSKTRNHGFDVRFVNASSTLMLKHEVEKWDETATSTVWVKLPFLEAATTTQYIWMYYNNSATTSSGAATSSVWSNGFEAVWHLGDGDSTASNFYKDSTANVRHGTLTDSDGDSASVSGAADGALQLAGDADYVNAGTFSVVSSAFTMSALLKVNSFSSPDTNERIINKADGTSAANHDWMLSLVDSTGRKLRLRFNRTNNTVIGTTALSANTWYHTAATFNNGTGTLFLNGKSDGSSASFNSGNLSNNTNPVYLGANSTPGAYLNGILDEVRISSLVRSADWLQQEYRYGLASSTTHAFGAEEVNGSVLEQLHYRWRANNNTEANASFLAAEDMVITGGNNTTASTTRLRMLIDETKSVATTTLYQLEYATSTSAGCSALTYISVANQASSTGYAWKMSPTAQFANGGATTNVASGLTDPTGSFRAGKIQDTAARLSSGIAHSAGEFTELEWSIEGTSLTNGKSYCFRVTNADDTTNFTYSVYPKINLASTTALSQAHYRWRANNKGETGGGESVSSPWWDSDFQYRRKITFNNAPSSEKLTNFPMNIFLSENVNDEAAPNNITYANVKAHGDDIRFVTATTSQMLKHEVESWNSSGTSTLWVKLPWLQAGTTTQHIWMYYGNSATTSGAATTSVWDSSFKGVWHFAATSTAARQFRDSTSNANKGTAVSFDSDEAVTGHINGALDFDGSNDSVEGPDHASLSGLSAIAFGAWIKPDQWASSCSGGDCNQFIVAKSNWASQREYRLRYETNPTPDVVVCSLSIDGTATLSGLQIPVSVIPTSSWSYIFCTWDAVTDVANLYFNGALYDSETFSGNNLFDGSADFSIGESADNGSGNTQDNFDGRIDEVRISNVARSADWLQAEYRYGFASSTTHSFGSEESNGSGASFLAEEDTVLTSANNLTASTTRLRILMDETNSAATTTVYQLEYATSTIAGFTACSALSTWVPVAASASSTSFAWKMSRSAQITHGQSTSNIASGLADPTGTFTAGKLQETSNRTTALTLSAGNFTELEWSIEATAEADGDSYCFRVTNADDTTNITFSVYPKINMATGTFSGTLTQKDFQIYQNANSLNGLTAWDSLSLNQTISSANDRIGGGDEFRLRMNITVGSSNMSASQVGFYLQYAELTSGVCGDITSWTNVGPKDTNDAVFVLTDNSSLANSVTIVTPLLSGSDVGGLYSEANPTAANPSTVVIGQELEYDWAVKYPSARYSSTDFCFRMIKSTGSALNTYTNYPQILTNTIGSGVNGAPTGGNPPAGAGIQTTGSGGGGSEEGGGGSGGGQQGGGGGGGGSEVHRPLFRFIASVLESFRDIYFLISRII